MLAVFMALSPRDRPRYYSEESRMRTRSNPLSPGLGFRPQPEPDKSLIFIDKFADAGTINPFAKNLDQYLQVYYWTKDPVEKVERDEDEAESKEKRQEFRKFSIKDPGPCRNETQFGYANGQPCVLVKMNKIVDFRPKPGAKAEDKKTYDTTCTHNKKAVAIHCHGEYPADVDNVGDITYYSESGPDNKCGSLDTSWFPYRGKQNRRDVYQAPYIWVQLLNPKPNVLINVLCRIYGQNIDFDRKTGRALTRFQVYVKNVRPKVSSPNDGEI
jgi:sodium/potassium-transporting ATPase subunit beta